MAKFDKGQYAYAEGLLHRFPVNIMRLHEAQQEYLYLKHQLDVHAQNYGAEYTAGGSHSDPVASRAGKLFALENLLRRLEIATVPVLRLRNLLKNNNHEDLRVRFYIMELYYFEGMSIADVMLHIGKRSIGYMRRQRRLLVDQLIRRVESFSNSR